MAFDGAIEDRVALRELLDSYADAVNQRDAQAWGALWTDDAVWSFPDIPEFGTIIGKQNIIATWLHAMTLFPGVVFEANPGKIEVRANEGWMRSYTTEVYNDPETAACRRDKGVYEDQLAKIDGVWRFQNRVFRYLHRG